MGDNAGAKPCSNSEDLAHPEEHLRAEFRCPWILFQEKDEEEEEEHGNDDDNNYQSFIIFYLQISF